MARTKSSVKKLGYADPRGYEYALVDIELLLPDPGNFRIPTQESSLDATFAVLDEPPGLLKLASDLIDTAGTNPAELLNVVAWEDKFIVVEGNRRLIAQRLLHNPEEIRERPDYPRWVELSKRAKAKKLPTTVLVVIGKDHDQWVDRRHLGPQEGVGLVPWNARQKVRRDLSRGGKWNRAELVLEGLRDTYPERFKDLDPPRRTFTTFERLLESADALAHIGIDFVEDGSVVLTKGERSVRLLEQALADLRRNDDTKLTSRRIHDREAIGKYLREVDTRIGDLKKGDAIQLKHVAAQNGGTRLCLTNRFLRR